MGCTSRYSRVHQEPSANDEVDRGGDWRVLRALRMCAVAAGVVCRHEWCGPLWRRTKASPSSQRVALQGQLKDLHILAQRLLKGADANQTLEKAKEAVRKMEPSDQVGARGLVAPT